jgi:hypothetical protein
MSMGSDDDDGPVAVTAAATTGRLAAGATLGADLATGTAFFIFLKDRFVPFFFFLQAYLSQLFFRCPTVFLS